MVTRVIQPRCVATLTGDKGASKHTFAGGPERGESGPRVVTDIFADFRRRSAHRNVFSRLLGHIRYVCARIFGCWHRNMSLPVTRGGETYRVCVRCGMRRQFHLGEWKMKGRYYNQASWTSTSKPV